MNRKRIHDNSPIGQFRLLFYAACLAVLAVYRCRLLAGPATLELGKSAERAGRWAANSGDTIL